LRQQLRPWLPRAERVRAQLRAAGCPVDPEAIGLSRDALRESYLLARQIRTRYTVLDLAAETGWFEPCLEALFRSGGLWGPARA
jgi:glycerol-1-phosphate dehydrogenase [NAD(P)+]